MTKDETVRRWVQQAQHDLDSARRNFEIELCDVCLLLCQQAVEKMLKALYIAQRKEEPPRIHSLRRLVELTGLPTEVLARVAELDSLYIVLRYPDVSEELPFESCDRDDAESGLEKAQAVLDLIARQILRENNGR
jgi:HEPN domain-containing protein